jgi:hypothetical protein
MLVRFSDHEVTQSYHPGPDCTNPVYPGDKEYIEIDLPFMPQVGERYFFSLDAVNELIRNGINEKYEKENQKLLSDECAYTGVIENIERRITKDGFIVEANIEFVINDYSFDGDE